MSMGWLGITLGAALFGCLVWLMVDQGWLSLDSEGMIAWVVLVILSLILATGMSWSHIRRRMSGQFDVDEKDD
jgi:membrane protein DedA with SNARE-associated domain